MRSIIAVFAAIAPVALAQGEAACSGLHLVYARATTEPPANYAAGQFDTAAAKVWSKGYGAAGMSLFNNLTFLVPGATGYPVHYPAAMGTQDQGSADMIKHLEERSKACPQQKYALGGHSQGGFAVTGAVPKMSKDLLNRVVAVTMFGSPACNAQIKDRCISYCNSGDSVCSGRAGGAPPKGGFVSERALQDFQAGRAPDCAKSATLKTSGLGTGGHLGYNADGTYVGAAACYIAAQYKKTAGGA